MSQDERVGKKICGGRYTILDKLGSGGMGRVYLARDEASRTKVSLKMVLSSGTDAKAQMQELRELYRKIEGLYHPHIAVVKHLVVIPEFKEYALEMEYVPGLNLADYRKKQPGEKIGLDQAVRFASEVASGLDLTHANQIVHLDIKPENIVVSVDNKAKIVDFGLPRRFDTVQASTAEELERQIVGTLAYMSPEQWRCETPDKASDIWSLGVVVYEMIASVRPFDPPLPCPTPPWPHTF